MTKQETKEIKQKAKEQIKIYEEEGMKEKAEGIRQFLINLEKIGIIK